MKDNYAPQLKAFAFCCLFTIFSFQVSAQVGIGTTNPNPNALLDIDASTTPGGLLLPRMNLAGTNSFAPMTGNVAGMVVYNIATAGVAPNNVTPGYYYNDGSKWVRLAAVNDESTDWKLNGNASTVPGVGAGQNYLGTTDAQALIFSTQATQRMRLLANGQITINNTGAPTVGNRFTVTGETGENAINGYVPGNGIAIYGRNYNNGIGVQGDNDGNGSGVSGRNFGTGYGVNGYNNNNAGSGVYGRNTVNGRGVYGDNDAVGYGVYGRSQGGGTGVYGTAVTIGNGVYGINSGGTGSGVYGRNTVNGNGVEGYNDGTGNGVYGRNVLTGVGVRGEINGTGTGVYGISTGIGNGVFGNSSSVGVRGFGGNGAILESGADGGYGAVAWNTTSSGLFRTGLIAIGQNLLPIGYQNTGALLYGNLSGAAAFTNDVNGTGLIATGNGSTGSISLTTGSGISAKGNDIGVFGYASNTSSLPNLIIGKAGGYFANAEGGFAYVGAWADPAGGGNNADIAYKIIGTGTVSTIVKDVNETPITMFAPEAPEILFQDYGIGKLTNGSVIIQLDPNLSKNIRVDDSHPMKVFVQLEGDCNGVYVTSKSANSFTVKELQGGKSNVPFSWSIVATRADEVIYNDKGVAKTSYNGQRFPLAPKALEIIENEVVKSSAGAINNLTVNSPQLVSPKASAIQAVPNDSQDAMTYKSTITSQTNVPVAPSETITLGAAENK